MWDERCRGNVCRNSGHVDCEVRGHIKRNSARACSVRDREKIIGKVQ